VAAGAPRTDRRRAALVLFGLWMVAGYVVFSFSQGTFHAYYTSAMAPAVAALAATAIVMLGDRVRASWIASVLLAVAIVGTAILSFIILGRTPALVPWLRWVVLAGSAVAAMAIVLVRLRGRLPRRAVLALALAGSGLALLAGPAAYSIATVGHGQTGSNPTAGPASVAGSGFGGGFAGGGHGGSGRFAGTPGTSAGGGAAGFGAELGRGFAGGAGAGSRSQSDQANAALAGFMGADPAPTVAQLESLVRSGQLRYVLVGGRGGGGFAAGGGGGFGGGGGRDSGVSAERTQWVESHCQTVTVPGASTSDSWPLRVHASRRLVTAPSSYGWRRDEASDRITRRCLGCPGLACARRGGVGERRRDRLCHG